MAALVKDPNAVLDYGFNWATWLGADTITTSTWVVTGATKNSDTHDATTTTVWLSAGVVGTAIKATNHIVTAGGRTDERTMTITPRER